MLQVFKFIKMLIFIQKNLCNELDDVDYVRQGANPSRRKFVYNGNGS